MWVHPKIQAGVRASGDGHHPLAHGGRSYANSLPLLYVLSASSARVLLLITSYSSWMFSNFYPSLLASEPFTTWPAGARVSSKSKLLGRACG